MLLSSDSCDDVSVWIETDYSTFELVSPTEMGKYVESVFKALS